MSEIKHFKNNWEQEVVRQETTERLPAPHEKLLEPVSKEAKAEKLANAREAVEENVGDRVAIENNLHPAQESSSSLPSGRAVISKELKQISKDRELNNIRRHLPRSQKTLSKVIHQPTVQALSDVASKTVSRPSGLLGGGLLALIGTSGYYFLAKHVGFSYNYSVFLALFVGGFILGIVLELIAHVLMRPRRRQVDQ